MQRRLVRAPRLAAFLCLVTAPLAALAALAAPHPPSGPGVASAHPAASAAGLEMLAKGGNAFDAAIAVSAALAVVEPTGSGLAGGGFFLLHVAKDGRDVMIDARERAPAAASRDMFLGPDGNPVPRMSLYSPLASAIPGEPAGFEWLSKHYGRLPLEVALAPAIRLAREGFPVYPRLQSNIQRNLEKFRAQPEVAAVFLREGETPALGTIIRQPQLERTLQQLAKEGVPSFYTGRLSKRILSGMQKLGGNWTAADLAAYRVVEREPLRAEYRGAKIVSSSPPSAGGQVLINALNVLSGYDLKAVDPATRVHLVVEAMRRAHRDRAAYLGDPDFVPIPIQQLLSLDYAAGQRTSLRLDRATPSAMLADPPGIAQEGDDTTHFSILDQEGNRVGGTITLNFLFGSGLVIPGTGMFLNNQMDDFSVKPGTPNGFGLIGAEANAIAPGKRPLSSTTPTFIETDRGLMILGSPGGSYIPGTVLNATLAWLDGADAEQVVARPRIHHQYLPDVLQYETDALAPADVEKLKAMGHTLREANRRWGNLQVVTWDYQSGQVTSASDPRGKGEGQVY